MADYNLKTWAKKLVTDPLIGNPQRRQIEEEEWLQGLGRLNGLTNQLFNTLMYLVTSHAPPVDTCPYPFKADQPIPDEVALHMNGQAISAHDYPVLHATYGDNLPDMTADNLTGFIWIVRKQ